MVAMIELLQASFWQQMTKIVNFNESEMLPQPIVGRNVGRFVAASASTSSPVARGSPFDLRLECAYISVGRSAKVG
jgi:hypothetical protein